MKKKYFQPYDIKIKYEYETYKYVGRDYGNSKDAYLGWLANLARFLRKWRNKKQKRYAFCNTYTEWECHVKALVRKDIFNRNDLLHWLYAKRNFEEKILEFIKIILIPIYLVLLSVLSIFEIPKVDAVWIFIFAPLIIMITSLLYLNDAINKVNFYNDFIKIISMNLETNGYA